ncbi:DNA-dependent protein kinase catalytic subunit isoform X1 [Megalops cyprinoides]|uniref:DNA-dependent protein kinase catalytic subunit isoform X1 n=1 Tax=Megalops cyprinoides TaxID=118141 RepID=UPI0018642F65|nr:DNA-dependent protein kinase catalytic subunit isoform X1 [Megalops cyprinoides]
MVSNESDGAVEGFRGYLTKLHSLLDDTDTRNAALQCHDIIGDLGQDCMTTKTENELVLQISLLFSKEDGLLSFLRKSLNSKELTDARVEILILLEKVLQRLSPSVKGWEKNYAIDIKDTCLIVYTKDKAAKCRAPALELLIKLLYMTKDSCIIQDFSVGDMFNKFYGELCQKSKIPDTVLGNIYELLGVLGEVQPVDMINNTDKLYKAYLGELRSQMMSSTKEPKLPLVAGCLKGITALMVNFTKSIEEDPKTSKEIFDYALKAISPQVEMKRYAVTFAGLRLFAKHAAQFSSCLMDHYRTVFDVMSKWCGHRNAEMKKTSYYALEAFFKQVAALVAEDVELHKNKLKFFMQKFCAIIKTMESTHKELSIAIRGYGLFAAPCKVVCPQDVDLMYTELIQRCKQMYLTESDTEEDNIFQLPSFLDSIASILFHLDRVPEVYRPVLERLLVVQIDCYPQYSQRMQSTCCRSIIKVLVAMASKGPMLWSFIATVVHQGVIRVWSKPPVLNEEEVPFQFGTRPNEVAEEATQMRTGRWKIPSYRDYLDLFGGLLDCEHLMGSEVLDGTFQTQNAALKSLNRLIYDEMIKSVLKIIDKLDLSVQKLNPVEEREDTNSSIIPSSDPTDHVLPNRPKDFTAFINLVEFSSELLLQRRMDYFEQWVYPFSYELILQSTRFPLVSGFYKMLSVSMKIAKRIKYFQNVGNKSFESNPQDTEKSTCFALFAKFGKEVSMRLKRYKDELLASCLTFVLSLHHDMVALDMTTYIPALKTAFKLGLSHAPLANAALDALEEWSCCIPRHSMEPYYREVLPCLDSYLKTAAPTDEDKNSLDVKSLSSGEEKGYSKILMRLLKRSKYLAVGEESPSALVRCRVVQLLGHLGGQLNRNLVTATSSEVMMKRFVAWDSERRLGFAVPFADMKPIIYLDTYLPRITELALSTSNRQTKVAACELLHSTVVYMLGKASQIPGGKNATPPMHNLHKRIFPVLLRLACDVDQVTRQLFKPLVMQIIHWFTNNKTFESQDTVLILEAILDGVVDPVDSTLRDFCGQCIQEFLKWSIKQTTPKQQERSPVNIKSLFKRIYSLALHPSAFKRLGAALAFNNIYKLFREEKTLVEQFVFEALVIFVESLSLAHSDERSLGTLQQCADAIDHLKRIIKYNSASLNQTSKRRIPRGFPPDQSVSLSDVVMWILLQCGRPQTECRHKCMELFYEFVPLLPGKKNPAAWLEDLLKQKGVDFLIHRFEGGGHENQSVSGILSQATLLEYEGPFSLKATLQWFDLFLAALDCYNTFIGLHLIKPCEILGVKKSRFLQATHFFINQMAMQDLSAVEKCFSVEHKGSIFSPKERQDYNYSKGTIIVRLMEFVTMVLDKCQQNVCKLLEKDVLNSTFFELVAMTVCEPSNIGFNMADIEVMTNLPEVCVPLLKALSTSPYSEQMKSSITKKVSPESVEELCDMDLYDPEAQVGHARLGLMLSACKQLHRAGVLNSTLHSQDTSLGPSLGSRLLSVVYKGIAPSEQRKSLPSIDVGSRKLADGLLQLALSLGGQSEPLVDLLLNTTVLSVPLPGSCDRNYISFGHGEYFYSLFQTTINSELLRNLDVTVPLLMKSATNNSSMVSTLLNGMLDQSFRERSLQKSQGCRLVEWVLKSWISLQPWWAGASSSPESKMATLTLLSKVLQIDSAIFLDTSNKGFEAVFSTYITLITDTVLPLNLKSHALIILPYFTTLPEEQLMALKKALEVLVASHFPMQSDEFPKGSLQFNNYVDCIKKFLDALELSRSPMLLKLMAEVLCRDERHVMEDSFQTTFKRIAKRSSCEQQVLLLDTVYRTFQLGDLPSSSMYQAILERVLLTLILQCSTDALRQFFIASIAEIMTTLQARFMKSNGPAFEVQIIKKKGCYKLLEVLYSHLPKEEVYSKDSKINQAFLGKEGKVEGNELSKTLLKSCFETFTENMAGETQLLEKRRQYHCAAYNCAIAVISCSFNETKFYQGFLFTEKPEKNQFILENLIDTQKTYRFPVEVEVPLEMRNKFVTIRKEVSEEKEEEPHYLSTQSYMTSSSLSEEMSQFDFSTGLQSFSYSSEINTSQKTTNKRRERMEEAPQNETVELEMDELNQHECMATMTALIKHMQKNNITPTVQQGTVPTELPPWMKFLHGKLANSSTQLNVRLFIAKLIINTEEVFRPYAKLWLGPLLQLVVSGNDGGDGIHFMIVDIVVTVLSWTNLATPKGNTRDEVLANQLLEFLMKNCFHTKRAIFRHNLEIIKTVVECWKDCLVMPYRSIYERFSGTDPNSKDNSVGLQLLGIVLANNLPPYDPSCGIEHERYFRSLVNNLTLLRFKEIYSAASEIIGLTMQYMAEKERQSEGLLFDLTASKLKDLKKAEKNDKFIICLSKVSKHFPQVMDRFLNQVFFLLPKMHGILKTHCLECVLSRASDIPDIYLELKNKDLAQVMGHRDEARQMVCLDIVHKILVKMTPEEVKEILGVITSFITHPSPVCRERMYDILMWIHDNYSDNHSQSDHTSVEVFNKAKETLLQGFLDENQGLQLYVHNFWSHERRLPVTTLERMLVVLHSLYSNRTEQRFLSLATNLLLELTSRSPDYNRAMFEYPLSECKFQDYVIDSSWRHRSTILTPMFAETLTTQDSSHSRSQESAMSPSVNIRGPLRVTQATLEFTPTQTAGRRKAYNWLTGCSVDTLAEYSMPSSDSLSSLMVFGKKTDQQQVRKAMGADFGRKHLSTDEADSRTSVLREQRADILRLKRKFLKDHEKASMKFARKEIFEQKQEREKVADQKVQRDAQVTLYRNYRLGDLPDIQIQHSSLIAPLQALAQRDHTLAKQLFSSLFAGILLEMGSKSAEEKQRITEQLQEDINNFLAKSMIYFPPFVACIQEISYQHKELREVQPSGVSSSCLGSLQQPMGILLLEESLLRECISDEPPVKRARMHKQLSPDTERWIHLAKLYRSLGDYDIVRGIFSGKIGTKPITCAALQAEGKCDFAEAAKLYNEALNTEEWMDGEPTDAEKDFWEIAALEAYSHLTEWKSLQYCCTVNIDDSVPIDLQKIWTNPFYQEVYLPYLMRSMLKQLQLGEQNQSLLSFVDGAMKVEERKNIMESQYSQELSLLYILQEDYDRAKYYVNNSMQVFMQNYSSIDSLLNESRLIKLHSVQALTEIQDFLNFITGDVSLNSLKNVIRVWTDRYPDTKMDPMNVWDDIITSRCFFLDKIAARLTSSVPSDCMEVDGDGAAEVKTEPDRPEDLSTLIKNCKFSMKLRMADSAMIQNNFSVASKILKELHREAKTQSNWLLQWVHSFSRFSHRRCQNQSSSEQILTVLKTIPLLEEIQIECQNSHIYQDHQILLGTTYDIMASLMSKDSTVLESIGNDKAKRLVELSGLSSPSHQQVMVGLQQRALEFLYSAVKKVEEEVQISSGECVDTPGAVEAYMALANFCDKKLRHEEQSDHVSEFPELTTFPAIVVEMLLKALKMNSEEARLKFPRLLQIIELYPGDTLNHMARKVLTVPCWQLIGWISQMMALLDKQEAVAVQQVIQEIAEFYPQAIIYPYMISSESYDFEDSASGHRNKEFVTRLKELLNKGVVVKDFIDALQQLTNPEMLFKDWWDDVKNELNKPKTDSEKMKKMYDEMYSSLGDQRAEGFGSFRKRFIKRFAKDIEQALGVGGSKLFEKKNNKTCLKSVDELQNSMRKFQKEPGNLKEYSPWMSSFRAEMLRNELEIPGQYHGRSKPLPEYHTKIVGFDERVKVMASIRKPKRVIIRGDDEREYPFLVKGGEDLRQDQRIEQLFSVMNTILSHDASCSQRNMALITYQVVPMTTRIGLIEWMGNTCTLKDFLSSRRTEEEKQNAMRPNETYENWLNKVAGKVDGIQRYTETYKKASRHEAVTNFRKMEHLVPGDLLRRAFLKMSTTPEAFLFLRSHFASSHALMCISQWILGIGDRHLSNFLINLETGGMVGIDFGHAFGSATQFLPVPELMPFRLTQQFLNLMQPMRETGLIKSTMVHSLRAYRANPDLLLNTMDIFVKEPSLDWKNFALKQLKKGGTWTHNVNTKEINWYPIQKVNFALRKLDGANPAVITSEELKLGFEKEPAFKGMLAVARGQEEHNIRARERDDGLSVETQVDCLLDQATDPNVLGRVWTGWEPWI